LAKLRRDGLLQASFIPPAAPRDLRALTWDRMKLVQERGWEVNRVPDVWERANMKLAVVATNILGGSGRAILAAVVDGRADPAMMAEWPKGRWRRKMPPLAQTLTGRVRDHHRRLRTIPLTQIDCLDEPIDALSAESTHALTDLRGGAPPSTPAAPSPPAEQAPATAWPQGPLTLARAVSVLETIPGVNQRGAERLVAEWGIDRGRFGTAEQLSAWSGVASGHDESAGTQRSGTTRKGHRTLRAGLTPWAHAAARTKGTYLSAVSHRVAARRGQKRADPWRVAYAIVVSAFQRLSRSEPDRELGAHNVDAYRRH
jgi:transposase